MRIFEFIVIVDVFAICPGVADIKAFATGVMHVVVVQMDVGHQIVATINFSLNSDFIFDIKAGKTGAKDFDVVNFNMMAVANDLKGMYAIALRSRLKTMGMFFRAGSGEMNMLAAVQSDGGPSEIIIADDLTLMIDNGDWFVGGATNLPKKEVLITTGRNAEGVAKLHLHMYESAIAPG